MSKKDPAILFYTADFIVGTLHFSFEQKGQYIQLLCEQHQIGNIPESRMVEICGGLDSPVIGKFIRNENGKYFNDRMNNEIQKRAKYNPYKIASATLGGLISTQKLKAKQIKFVKKHFDISLFENLKTNDEIKIMVKKWLSKCLTIYENENENENENRIGNGIGNENENEKLNIKIRQANFKETIRPYIPDKINKSDAYEFFLYWAQELNDNGTPLNLLRWENEKTWSLGMRISTWIRNKKNFKDLPKTEKKPAPEKRRGESQISDIVKLKNN